MSKIFDYKKPTVQMLGRFQPWHTGHFELFKRAFAKTGQVYIMIRDVKGASGGIGQNDNPFDFATVKNDIESNLFLNGYVAGEDFEIALVPNIVDISYGRGVGYTFTEHDLGEAVHAVSATKIRQEMRDKGLL